MNYQFEGEQIYGTMCHSCGNRSERTSQFLELEVNFKVMVLELLYLTPMTHLLQNNAKLEDCISESLNPETLSGNNQSVLGVGHLIQS